MHAIKPKGKGIISISVNDYDDQVEIKFSDNGIGMDEETQIKIFDPFFTTKGAYAKDQYNITGTGLGLSISHGIVERHGGKMAVECPPRGGAIFRITLPLVALTQDDAA